MISGLRSQPTPRGRSLLLAGAVAAVALVTVSIHAAPLPAFQQAVVLVAKRNPERRDYVAWGTAFHAGDGWFRTAAHVVETPLPRRYEGKGYDEWAVYQADEFGNPGRWIGRFEVTCVDRRWNGKDEDSPFPHDSALLKLLASSTPAAVLQPSERRPERSDRVSVWGFPMGRVLFGARAVVISVSSEWIRFQEELGTPTIGGHSGSPVVDAAGAVIGIFVGGITGVGEPGTAVPIWDAEAGCPKP